MEANTEPTNDELKAAILGAAGEAGEEVAAEPAAEPPAAEPPAETAAEPAAAAAEPAAPVPVDPNERKRMITLETSLVLTSHPEIIKLIGDIAKRVNGAAVLKSILEGASEAGRSVWTPGTPQQMEGVQTFDILSYTLDFSAPVRIKDFHDGLNSTAYRASFMHYRRPGDPIGRDYIQIQTTEDAQVAAAAKAEAAPVPKAEAAGEPAGQPLTGEAAKEKMAAADAPEPYGKYGVKEIRPDVMTGNVLDEDLNVVQAKIQGDPQTKDFYADFYMITSTGFFKAYRARGKTARAVVQNIQKFLANPDF